MSDSQNRAERSLKKLQAKVQNSEFSQKTLEEICRFADSLLEKSKPTSPTKVKGLEKKQAQENFSEDWEAWTDGSCFGNPGPGGWAYVLKKGSEVFRDSGFSRQSTNNIMELTAAIECLRSVPEGSSGILHADSQYVIRGITEWISGWKRKNWVKADKNPVLNAELWKKLDALVEKRKVRWVWVKGHDGNPENELCDLMAKQAIETNI